MDLRRLLVRCSLFLWLFLSWFRAKPRPLRPRSLGRLRFAFVRCCRIVHTPIAWTRCWATLLALLARRRNPSAVAHPQDSVLANPSGAASVGPALGNLRLCALRALWLRFAR